MNLYPKPRMRLYFFSMPCNRPMLHSVIFNNGTAFVEFSTLSLESFKRSMSGTFSRLYTTRQAVFFMQNPRELKQQMDNGYLL
jgi:hypothetical protein